MSALKSFMKGIMPAAIAVFVIGCATDMGIYKNKGGRNGVYKSDSPDAGIRRSFKLPKRKDAVASLARNALVGRWRTFVDTERMVTQTSLPLRFYESTWHLDEYVFN